MEVEVEKVRGIQGGRCKQNLDSERGDEAQLAGRAEGPWR